MADERMALRRTAGGLLDDVVVGQVSMFRAEMLDADRSWLCCYLPATGVKHDRITFDVTVRDGALKFEVIEMPQGSVSLDPSRP